MSTELVRRVDDERECRQPEYAVGTVAAVGFGGILVKAAHQPGSAGAAVRHHQEGPHLAVRLKSCRAGRVPGGGGGMPPSPPAATRWGWSRRAIAPPVTPAGSLRGDGGQATAAGSGTDRAGHRNGASACRCATGGRRAERRRGSRGGGASVARGDDPVAAGARSEAALPGSAATVQRQGRDAVVTVSVPLRLPFGSEVTIVRSARALWGTAMSGHSGTAVSGEKFGTRLTAGAADEVPGSGAGDVGAATIMVPGVLLLMCVAALVAAFALTLLTEHTRVAQAADPQRSPAPNGCGMVPGPRAPRRAASPLRKGRRWPPAEPTDSTSRSPRNSPDPAGVAHQPRWARLRESAGRHSAGPRRTT